MKLRVLLLGVLIYSLLALGSCTRKPKPDRIVDRSYLEVIKESRRDAMFYMARSFTPGTSIAISVKGKLVYSEGLGLASTDLEAPATRQTKFRIGGITQVLTSLAYYKMIEAGKLSADSTVQKYFPAFPEKDFPVTLQHLVNHTSGIRQPTDVESNWRGLNVGIRQGIDSFANDSLLFPPGAYQYPTNFGYNLLGAIMEEVEQQPFSKIIQEWVTDTLGLKNTVPDHPLITVKNRTNYFDRDMVAQVIHATFLDLRYRMPSDGYLSTAEDLVKLGNTLIYGNNISATIKEKMLTAPQINENVKLQIGNGLLFLQTMDGEPFIAARGNITGGGAMLIMFPDEEIVVAMMANIDDSMDELPALGIANNFKDFLAGTFKTQEQKTREMNENIEKDRARKEAEEKAMNQTENKSND